VRFLSFETYLCAPRLIPSAKPNILIINSQRGEQNKSYIDRVPKQAGKIKSYIDRVPKQAGKIKSYMNMMPEQADKIKSYVDGML
jgi:uncharacterized coiled-coil DUF342 family protein